MSSITVAELKQKRIELSNTIKIAVADFEKETGTKVMGIEAKRSMVSDPFLMLNMKVDVFNNGHGDGLN